MRWNLYNSYAIRRRGATRVRKGVADALFRDEWGAVVGGTTGAEMSKMMEQTWPDYHRQWVAVRTRFIDDWLAAGRAGAL
eukprot:gene1522-13899_t